MLWSKMEYYLPLKDCFVMFLDMRLSFLCLFFLFKPPESCTDKLVEFPDKTFPD